MAACLVEPPPQPAGGAAFSSLTLFECTIQNASMLVETMADKELMLAMKIVSGLNIRLMEVMEPRYSYVCQRSDDHIHCEQKLEQEKVLHGRNSFCDSSSDTGRLKFKEESEDSYSHVNIKQEEGFDEDDCVIMDEDFLNNSNDNSYSIPKSKKSRLSISNQGHNLQSGSLSTVNVNECKNVLRSAYKELKGNGPHLFDFSLPFDDPANKSVANNVLATAQSMCSNKQISDDDWWMNVMQNVFVQLCSARFDARYRVRKHRYRNSKVTRRQKSFELLASTLSTDQFDKYRLILSRDYTSSDEEGNEDGVLHVRQLPWESDEMRNMKRELDLVYSQNCATQKQRQQLDKVIRDSSVRSTRAPPEGIPNWAIQPVD